MNLLKLIAVVNFLLQNKESILELIKLLQSIFATEILIGDTDDVTLYADSNAYPLLSAAIAESGMSWQDFIKLLVANKEQLQELVAALVEIISLFTKK